MSDFFWRRRLKKQVRAISRNLPQLPDDVDDNMFIALANQAAETDKQSGGFDEFMFSEDGYETMPYEDSVDQFLNLHVERVTERQGRASIYHSLTVEHQSRRVEHFRRLVSDAEKELLEAKDLLAAEGRILAGSDIGHEGAKWAGVSPETTSRGQHVARRLLSLLVFVLVGAVDALVVFYSLRLLTPTEQEAMFFTVPAVGVQILFPHLVGKSLGVLNRKEGRKVREIVTIFAVGFAWVAYLYGMSQIRMNLLTKLYLDRTGELMQDPLLSATRIISIFILVGLGAWLMLRAMHENPHENKYSRLGYVVISKNRKLRRAKRRLDKAEAVLATAVKALNLIETQWNSRSVDYATLGESAKSTYRRALVNQVGDPEFTTKYLPKERFQFRKKLK